MQAQQNKTSLMATASANAPGLLQQVGMAGGAAVITVSFIHPIDVIKVSVTSFDERSFYGNLIVVSDGGWNALRDSLLLSKY
jgi:hypothetical protein